MRTARIACTLLACLAMAIGLDAQPSSKRTKVTFSGPFEIPNAHVKSGITALPPGTYIFELVESAANRHVVRVSDANGKVLSTILAIADYRLNATSKTVMYFSESAAGAPVAIKSWFYPGDNYGNRFIYPKVKAQTLAAQTNQPVPSYAATDANVNKDTAVQIQTPAKTEVAYNAGVFQDVDAKDTAGADGEAVTTGTTGRKALPKTASPLSGYAVTGFALLVAAWLFRRARIATSAN